jgi:hypothetical protein
MRITIDPSTVRVVDDYYFGNAYTVDKEDGPAVVVPAHDHRIVAETPRGELYIYNESLGFGPFKQFHAELLAVQIKNKGSINADKSG